MEKRAGNLPEMPKCAYNRFLHAILKIYCNSGTGRNGMVEVISCCIESRVCFSIFFESISCIIWYIYPAFLKNSYYNNNHGVLTPIRSLPYQLYISFFGILQLLLFISQFLPKVQSKFHQIRMKIVAIIDNYAWKIALFFIFEKNIDHPVNYKFQEWGKILHNEKNQTRP